MTETEGEGRLRSREWPTRYSNEDGDLVKLFFEPALAAADLYQRVTGYFSREALAMAARGLDALIENGGRMELVVGCTLEPAEVEAIEQGYDLREKIAAGLIERLDSAGSDANARERLGWLAWMIAEKKLDVMVAVPKDEHGRFRAGLGLYHAKCGVMRDAAKDRIAFEGSINETYAGWMQNGESFSVSCSWEGGRDEQRIESLEHEFARLWSNTARSAEVMPVPEAVERKLLEFLPNSDAVVRPPAAPEPEPIHDSEPEPELPIDELRRRVWSFLVNAPRRPDGALVAVETSAVEPWPHQLRAYGRMLDTWPCRLLIADEVGLGKTIEAGLLLRHAWISGLAKRVLILVPKAVLAQWQAELYEKFNLLVPIYTGRRLVQPEHHFRQGELEREVPREEWTREPLVLASSHLLRRADRRDEMLAAEDWDLIVLDEAHHSRRKGGPGPRDRGPNRLLTLMGDLAAKTRGLLLLTATPMQIDPSEIWELVRLLGLPPEWTVDAFRSYFERLAANPDIPEMHKLARLFQACEREYGPFPPEEVERVTARLGLGGLALEKVMRALREPTATIPLRRLSSDERRAALAILRAGSPLAWRMSRHTRSLLRAYHREGRLETPIAERRVRDLAIDLAPAERGLYDAMEAYISETYSAASADKKSAVGFVMTVYRQRLSSSFFALRRTLNRRLERLTQRDESAERAEPVDEWEAVAAADDSLDESMDTDDVNEAVRIADEIEEQGRITELLRDISRLGADTKARCLCEELRSYLPERYASAIVFTQFADTMEYLRDLLAEEFDLSIGTYSGTGGARRDSSGGWVAVSKEEIKRLLREGRIDLLVCTDAAGEGLNLQSCGLLVNYDLPWNPMKVEQRIGRIDRIGQKYAEVTILNLAYRDTVEADVYFSLSQRIGLFQGVVGKLQPILSQVSRKLGSAVLTGGDKTRARGQAVGEVETLVDQAGDASFDIDEVSEADLREPTFPPSPLKAADVEAILATPALLPASVDIKRLDATTFSLVTPGHRDAARVTARPDVFEAHCESLQLALPGGVIFSNLARSAGAADDAPPSKENGSLQDWLELARRVDSAAPPCPPGSS